MKINKSKTDQTGTEHRYLHRRERKQILRNYLYKLCAPFQALSLISLKLVLVFSQICHNKLYNLSQKLILSHSTGESYL